MNEKTKNAIVIERTFEAPVDLMWKMWTDPEHFKHWYGPQGFKVAVAEFDLRIGGKNLVCMEGETPNGKMQIWVVGEFTEIVPNELLVFTNSPSDENGNIVPVDGVEGLLITTVSIQLEDLGGRTKMIMTHAGLPADEQGASAGWEQAMSKLAEYTETVRKDNS